MSEIAAKGEFWPMGAMTTWSSFFASSVLLAIALSIVWFISGRLFFSYITVQALALALSCASYFKSAVQGIPLFPSDLKMAFAVFGVADSSNIVMTAQIAAAAVGTALLAATIRALKLGQGIRRGRLVLVGIPAVVLLAIVITPGLRDRVHRDGSRSAFLISFADAATPIYADTTSISVFFDMLGSGSGGSGGNGGGGGGGSGENEEDSIDFDEIGKARLQGDVRVNSTLVGGAEAEASQLLATANPRSWATTPKAAPMATPTQKPTPKPSSKATAAAAAANQTTPTTQAPANAPEERQHAEQPADAQPSNPPLNQSGGEMPTSSSAAGGASSGTLGDTPAQLPDRHAEELVGDENRGDDDIYIPGSGYVEYTANILEDELSRLKSRLASGQGPAKAGSLDAVGSSESSSNSSNSGGGGGGSGGSDNGDGDDFDIWGIEDGGGIGIGIESGSGSGGGGGSAPHAGPSEEATPDVIVILSESFWDMSTIHGVETNEYPTPHWRSLVEESGSVGGYMLSRTYGGGTADVEFEVLTGNIVRYLTSSTHSYDTVLRKPIMSLATIFKNMGYSTTAIHTYFRWFYNRDRVMPLLGFDKYIGLEDMDDPVYNGRYVSDAYFTKQIIEQLESTTKPQFIFGISMENHQPYPADRYEDQYGSEMPVRVLDDNMPHALRTATDTFLTGVRHSDEALKMLVDYLRTRERPTALLFYGDHQPSLALDFQLYQYTGQMEDRDSITATQSREVLSVPYVIWSNYKTGSGGGSGSGEGGAGAGAGAGGIRIDDIGSNFVGNMLLNYIGIEKPLFFHYLDVVFEDSFHYDGRDLLFVDSDGKVHEDRPVSFDHAANMLALLEYDMTLGKGYVDAQLRRPWR